MMKHRKTGVDIDDHVLSVGSDAPAPRDYLFDRRWLNVLWIVIVGSIVLLVSRVFYIAIIEHEDHASVAAGNTLHETPIIAPRGKIISSDGEVLVENKPNYSAVIVAQLLTENVEKDSDTLGTVLDLPSNLIYNDLLQARENHTDIVLKERLSHDEVVDLKSNDAMPEYIRLEKNALRVYRDAPFFAHIVGYEGLIQKEEYEARDGYLLTDRIGKTGLEYQYESFLHGTHGYERVLRDSRARVTKQLEKQRVVPGADLYLNIDAALQKYLTQALMAQLERADTKRAAAVAIDPRNGAVRALVSLPSYDNNAFADGIDVSQYNTLLSDPDKPLFDRVITGTYPPGSTVKPVLAVTALENNIISPDVQIESRGGLQYGRFFFGDWRAHGFTDMRRAIAVSSDVYFYTVGGGYGDREGLGIERMREGYARFGYGQSTGIDLPHESSGTNPDKQWKKDHRGERWYIGDTYHSSIGQGFMTATPLQVAMSVAAIANGGTVYEPRLASHVVFQDGHEEEFAPHVRASSIASPKSLRVAREGMRQTITEGTAQMLQSIDTPIAGKTGTAQFGPEDRVHSWFVSFAPYDNPEIVLLVMVENQTTDISSATVPVARDVYKWYFNGRTEDEKIINDENVLHL